MILSVPRENKTIPLITRYQHMVEDPDRAMSCSNRQIAYLRIVEQKGSLPLEDAVNNDRRTLASLLESPGRRKAKGKRTGRGWLKLTSDQRGSYVELTPWGLKALSKWDKTDITLRSDHKAFPKSLQEMFPPLASFGWVPGRGRSKPRGKVLAMAKIA